MPLGRLRFSVRRLMAATAAVAVSLAGFRYHPAAGTLVATILALSLARTFRAIDGAGSNGESITKLGAFRQLLASIGVVSAIIGIASLPGLLLVWGLFPPDGSWRVTIELTPIVPAVILIGAVLAIPIAYFMRRKFW
jgi:hypothetical protein